MSFPVLYMRPTSDIVQHAEGCFPHVSYLGAVLYLRRGHIINTGEITLLSVWCLIEPPDSCTHNTHTHTEQYTLLGSGLCEMH